jgi:hypothetical protein
MRASLCTALFSVLFLFLSFSSSFAYEVKTRYAVIAYEAEEHLRKFNKEVSLGSISHLLRNRSGITLADEVSNKLDAIVERVETILDMHPAGLQFRVTLLASDSDVQRTYHQKYGRKTDFIAFYSPREKTVYVSVDDIRLGVLAHELTHVILDHYFGVSPPVKIHEVLAQFVESHLRD